MPEHEDMERARHYEIEITDRQRQVWRLVAKGHTNGEIAEKLNISLDGAKWHVSELLTRLDANTREDLVEAWDAARRPQERMRRWLSGLSPLPLAQTLGVVAAVAAVGGAGALYVATDGLPGDDQYHAVADFPSPATQLTEAEAVTRAEDLANGLLEQYLTEYLPPRGATIENDFVEAQHQWMPPGELFVSPNGSNEWQSDPAATSGAWAFSWTAEDLGTVDGPLGGLGDIEVEVIFADTTQSTIDAARAQVRVSTGGMWAYGYSEGFHARDGSERFQPTRGTFHIAWLNGVVGGDELVLYRTTDNFVCTRTVRLNGSGGGGCWPFAGATRSQPLSQLGGDGAGFMNGVEVASNVEIRTDPDVFEVAIVSESGAEERFPTYPIPPELDLDYRVAFFSSPGLDGIHWFVAYDAEGNEIYRQGPWGVPGETIPPFFEPLD
ncbi:MAG: helix-turn-helix transcriptional regulator [Dehalococcoidia bacterium]